MARLVIIIAGCMFVTYLPRFLPMYVLTRMEIPKIIIAWLRYVPVAVLAALIAPGIAASERQMFISPANVYLLASIPAFLVAWRTKSMLFTVSAGMIVVFIFKTLL